MLVTASRLVNSPAIVNISGSCSSSRGGISISRSFYSSSALRSSSSSFSSHHHLLSCCRLRWCSAGSPIGRARAFSSLRPNSMVDSAEAAAMDAVQRRLMFDDECILVDESDRVVGHTSKYNCHLWENILKGNSLHRAFSVFLFNSKKELLLQQRSATKVTFPLVWTNTCCSHPLYRQSELEEEAALGVRNAAQRKLLDELGIPAEDVPTDQFMPLGRILYKAPSDGKWGEHELDYLLFIVRDVRMDPNPDEVADAKYVNRDQLKELLRKADAGEEGLKLSPWFRLVVDNFLFKWWDHVENGTLKDAADMDTIHKLT
ncbi:Isopentenyl-diphosphate Delta-isomerase II [Turnera subulata]|uniref:isopentenyl-diphosphate Delta-isomerase n=1 Tax=Turnera subulata TaxID=218843 RepID=A0A9Q0JPH9_9ROSI|nr:Isopentenyl-diphosphate Delta-isomerase II [Turnera subulata]